jgi:predicted esterase
MLGPKMPHVKWAFPNAPVQPVSCNMGMKMPSWFDLPTIPLEPGCPEDAAAFQAAVADVHALVRQEMQKTGVAAERVVLGGFSQSGAIAVQATLAFLEKLAGGVVRLALGFGKPPPRKQSQGVSKIGS